MANPITATSSGRQEILWSVMLLFVITIFLPAYFKTWFVEPTGNIKIAPFFGFLFGVGMLFRQRWAWFGALVLGGCLLLLFAGGIISDPSRPGFWVALVLDAGMLRLLYRGKQRWAFYE